MPLGQHIRVDNNEIFYSGTTSGPDGGTDTFCVIFSGEYPLYGAWKESFSSEYVTSIRIISFGYRSRENVGNPHPAARDHISGERAAMVKILIEHLFYVLSREGDVLPFCIEGVTYDNHIAYDQDWIATCL